ncbi:YeeE/YedE family protein, partial [Vibrio makurazakiensis]|uniref:DUF6691 family protein n=1 Tax=Vibrio makurazakiensis TaxID=2910250 RepID=UPI003D09FBB8
MNKSTLIRNVISLLSGILFGAGMIISGMADPGKVLGFLDVTGAWDPSLTFVMGGALLIFIPFNYFVIQARKQAVNGELYSKPKSSAIDSRLVGGAALFGIGWGLVGICPGPALSSLGSGSLPIIVFTLS